MAFALSFVYNLILQHLIFFISFNTLQPLIFCMANFSSKIAIGDLTNKSKQERNISLY